MLLKTLQARWVLVAVVTMTLINTVGGQDDQTDPPEEANDEGTSTEVIVLAALLSAFVLGNAACAAWWFICRGKTQPTPPPHPRDPNADAELGRLQQKLATEHSKRVRAEALVLRDKEGGLRPGSDFPSVGDVVRDVKHRLVEDALAWTEKACAISGSHTALPATIRTVLEHTFNVCREEVKRCLDERIQGLSAFLGKDEPVSLLSLSGGDSMNLDAKYVLYECLCRNYQTIVSVEPDNMKKLATTITRRCEGPENLAKAIIFGGAWPSFDALMQHYIMLFLKMDLQKPRMGFKENDLGKNKTFDVTVHRDWAPYSEAPVGQQCSVVFPAITVKEGRAAPGVKIGVVRVPVESSWLV